MYIAFGEVPVVPDFLWDQARRDAIVVQAAHRIGSRALKNNGLWAIAAASFTAIFAFNVPFPADRFGSGRNRLCRGRLAPRMFRVGGIALPKSPSALP